MPGKANWWKIVIGIVSLLVFLLTISRQEFFVRNYAKELWSGFPARGGSNKYRRRGFLSFHPENTRERWCPRELSVNRDSRLHGEGKFLTKENPNRVRRKRERERKNTDVDSIENEKASRWMSGKELLLFLLAFYLFPSLYGFVYTHFYILTVNKNAKERKGSVFSKRNVLSFSLILH